ncbi:MAG: hypothetical protein JO316_25435 [Abitibacteriaceae bacterium]|nr:hypothetical protein [Abditibacteriaceae bacterium]
MDTIGNRPTTKLNPVLNTFCWLTPWLIAVAGQMLLRASHTGQLRDYLALTGPPLLLASGVAVSVLLKEASSERALSAARSYLIGFLCCVGFIIVASWSLDYYRRP